MTGSPIFKVKSELRKKQRQRQKEKIAKQVNLLRREGEPPTKNDVMLVPISSNTTNIPLVLNFKESTTGTSNRCKSICNSSLSSFVYATKQNVKRKLDFDAALATDDTASDGVSGSFRFSAKNLSFHDFRSKHSSLLDGKSLPEEYSVTFSPNKNRFRRTGSYSRSSAATSSVNCRRKLFTELQDASSFKKCRLSSPPSPVFCRKAKSKRREIKLSLQKKFPGVPSSDSARSGLLLNLAFSKYNLSTAKRDDNISVGFVDHGGAATAVSSIVKKDFAQYSQLKQQDNCCSPVFNAIKRVRRRLNLEEQDSFASKPNRITGNDFAVAATTAAIALNEASSNLQLQKTTCLRTEGNDLKITATVALPSDERFGENHENITHLRSSLPPPPPPPSAAEATAAVVVENTVSENIKHDSDDKETDCRRRLTTISSLSPSPLRVQEYGGLIKNSKLRSTLRNKILHLSKCSNDSGYGDKRVVIIENHQEFPSAFKCGNTKQQQQSSKVIPKVTSYDGIKVGGVMWDAAKKERSKFLNNAKTRLSSAFTKEDSFQKSEWIKHDSFQSCNVRRLGFRHKSQSFVSENSNLFLRKHMERFLKDCLVAAERGAKIQDLEEDEGGEKADDSGTNITGYLMRNEYSREEQQQYIIENIATQEEEEGVKTKSEQIIIENVISQETSSGIAENRCGNALTDTVFTKSSIATATPEIDESTYSPNSKVEPTVVAAYSCVQFHAGGTTCTPKTDFDDEDTQLLNTANKKTKSKRRKNDCSNNDEELTCRRLDKLLNREKSSFRMWEYEMSRMTTTAISSSYTRTQTELSTISALFTIEKMWKECSYLILLCAIYRQDLPDLLYELHEIKSFGSDISNLVVIVVEQEYCPKSLNYLSVFQLFPPWNIIQFNDESPLVILKPTKMKIILEEGKAAAAAVIYRDPSLPNVPVITRENEFCCCEDTICNCSLSDGYLSLIQPLLFSNINTLHSRNYSQQKLCCDSDSLNSTYTISDIVTNYKLYSARHLCLDMKILHLHSEYDAGNTFLSAVCLDEKKNICCVLIKGGKIKEILAHTKATTDTADVIFRFTGVIPWKLIPAKNVPLFTQYLNFVDIPSELIDKINTENMIVFVLSEEDYSTVKRL